jgi:hypothetical protein
LRQAIRGSAIHHLRLSVSNDTQAVVNLAGVIPALSLYLSRQASESQRDSRFFLTTQVRAAILSGQIPDAAHSAWKRHPDDLADGWQVGFPGAASTNRGRVRMKSALVTFIVLAATNTTFAVAQDGSGSGPPKKSTIVIPSALPAPTPTSPSVPMPRLSEPEQR